MNNKDLAVQLIENTISESDISLTRLAYTDEQHDAVKNVLKWIRRMGKEPRGGELTPEVPMSWNPDVIIDLTYNGSQIMVGHEGEIKVYGEVVNSFEEFQTAVADGEAAEAEYRASRSA